MREAVALIVYIVWFFTIFVVRSVIQRRMTGDSGLRPGGLAMGSPALEMLAAWLLVTASLLGVAAPLAALAGLPDLWESQAASAAGLVGIITGVVSTYVAQVAMGREWRIGVDPAEKTNLVTSGVFGVVRNPFFAAMLGTSAAFVLFVPNVVSLAAWTALVAAIELQVRYVEEPHLIRQHGDSYLGYSRKVGRFLPGVGLLS